MVTQEESNKKIEIILDPVIIDDVDLSFKDAMGILLKVKSPFYVKKATIDLTNYEIHVHISYDKVTTFTSPCCQEENCKIHNKAPRIWRALDLLEYKTILHLDQPNIKCPNCGKKAAYLVDWARPQCGLTIKFEQRAIANCKTMTFVDAAFCLGETDKRLASTVHKAVQKARLTLNWKDIKAIGIDETSRAKGHNYISVFVDLYSRNVLFIADGKDASVFDQFCEELKRNHGNPSKIIYLAMDMSVAFISGAETFLPNADIIFDKFHVIKLMNEAIDKIRRQESLENPILRGTRYIWLHNPENLNKKQREQLIHLSKRNLKTGRAYRYKLELQKIYAEADNYQEAEFGFNKLISWGTRSRLEPLENFAKTLKAHLDGILNHFDNFITSGVIEGLNSKIQEIKRRARGFPNTDNFKNMIYLHLGGLKIPKLYKTGEPYDF